MKGVWNVVWKAVAVAGAIAVAGGVWMCVWLRRRQRLEVRTDMERGQGVKVCSGGVSSGGTVRSGGAGVEVAADIVGEEVAAGRARASFIELVFNDEDGEIFYHPASEEFSD